MTNRLKPYALRISLTYCIVALLWIAFSDAVLLLLVPAQAHALSQIVSIFKGFGFVLVTTAALYIVLRKLLMERAQVEHDLEQERFINPVAVVVLDTKGTLTYINQRAQELFGFKLGEAPHAWISAGEWTVTDYHGNPLPLDQSAFATVLRTRQPVFGIRAAITLESQRRIFLDVNAAPLLDERGNVRAVVVTMIDTTKAKHEEDHLRESEETFRLLFRNNPLPMWIYDLDTLVFLDVNNAAVEKYGYSHDEFLKMRLTDVRPPEDVERLIADVQRTRPDLKYSGQWRHMLRDGRIIYVEIISHKLKYAGHAAALTVALDITERKEMFEHLTESEERYRLLVEHSPTSIAIHQQGVIVFANPAMARLLGEESAEAVIGKSVHTVVHPDNIPSTLERIGDLNSGKHATLHYENRYLRADGSVIDVEVTSASLIYQGKQSIQLLAQDITERKRAEAQINQLNVDLEKRIADRTTELNNIKDRVEAILNSSNDAIIFCRTTGSIEQVNPAFEEVFRQNRDAPIFRPFASLVEPAHAEQVEQTFASVIEARQSRRLEVTALCGDGTTFEADIIFSPVLQNDRSLLGIVASIRDVSEHKQMESHLRQMLQREMEVGEMKSRYVSMAAHDLRNPLAAIMSSVSLIETYYDRMDAASRRAKFTQIYEGVDVMRNMLDDILTIGQAEAGKLRFSPEPIRMEPVCRAIVNQLTGANGVAHALDFSVSGTCETAHLDPKLLRHILANLVSNAIKYSEPSSPVIVRVTCEPKQVTIRVQDHGIGIPAHEQGRMFQSFFRASNAAQYKGTGLGLAIVRQSVDLHGGEIHFESEEGRGTTFTVTLPVVDVPLPQPE